MEADILLFMGQSNMAGRGDYRLAPEVLPGAAYEYRAVTEPDTLVPLTEPFGVNENREGGVFEPGMKTGSMAAAFVNACYRKLSRYRVPKGDRESRNGSRRLPTLKMQPQGTRHA